MIFVTQGHQKSIGPEIFFKALLQLPKNKWRYFNFIASKSVIEETLSTLKIDFSWNNQVLHLDGGQLGIVFLDDINSFLPASTQAMEVALDHIKSPEDILLTMPTSKDQLILSGEKMLGHTEYLRKRLNCPDTAMLFSAPDDFTLLVTDHLPLSKISEALTEELIFARIENCLRGMQLYFDLPDEVLIAGINPHCGEGGLLGVEDQRLFPVIDKLKGTFPQCKFFGPYSADTLHFHKRPAAQLKVYMYHDQGLPLFKAKHGTLGLNISLGLPFLRMSVDHGTAFELYGKNCADAQGALYLLQAALAAIEKFSSNL